MQDGRVTRMIEAPLDIPVWYERFATLRAAFGIGFMASEAIQLIYVVAS
jgi:hypothetical protein